jgi:hypothetical protein
MVITMSTSMVTSFLFVNPIRTLFDEDNEGPAKVKVNPISGLHQHDGISLNIGTLGLMRICPRGNNKVV